MDVVRYPGVSVRVLLGPTSEPGLGGSLRPSTRFRPREAPSWLAGCKPLADAVMVTFAFALRGAGDTRFVTAVTFCLAWPIMVLPTYFVVRAGGSIYAAWWFATTPAWSR